MRNINIMFREVKDMVYEQGTMIDRIDYNIERADRNVKSANKELDEVDRCSADPRRLPRRRNVHPNVSLGRYLLPAAHQSPAVDLDLILTF